MQSCFARADDVTSDPSKPPPKREIFQKAEAPGIALRATETCLHVYNELTSNPYRVIVYIAAGVMFRAFIGCFLLVVGSND